MRSHKKPLNHSITIGCALFILILCALLSADHLMYERKKEMKAVRREQETL